MTVDIKKLMIDYNIPFQEGGKNWQPGWIQVNCPFPSCSDKGFHGGFKLSTGSYHCWKCGFHPLVDVLVYLTGFPFKQVLQLRRKYEDPFILPQLEKRKKATPLTCKYPDRSLPVTSVDDISGAEYLKNRKFNPFELESTWNLRYTGHLGDYKFRIIAPIFLDGVMVSYQGRDITNQQTLRYKACAIENEVIHHKHIVYGIDYVKDSCVIVEGITDVWRLGPGAVALFGTEWTREQLLFLSNKIQRSHILLDKGTKRKAEELAYNLSLLGISATLHFLEADDPDDPGGMSDEQASEFMKSVKMDTNNPIK